MIVSIEKDQKKKKKKNVKTSKSVTTLIYDGGKRNLWVAKSHPPPSGKTKRGKEKKERERKNFVLAWERAGGRYNLQREL